MFTTKQHTFITASVRCCLQVPEIALQQANNNAKLLKSDIWVSKKLFPAMFKGTGPG